MGYARPGTIRETRRPYAAPGVERAPRSRAAPHHRRADTGGSRPGAGARRGVERAVGVTAADEPAGGAAGRQPAQLIKVTKLDLEGTKALTPSQIKAVLGTRVSSRFFWGRKRYFDRRTFDDDLKRVVRFYQDHGYRNARVTAVNAALNDKQDAVALSITVDEGAPRLVAQLDYGGIRGAAAERPGEAAPEHRAGGRHGTGPRLDWRRARHGDAGVAGRRLSLPAGGRGGGAGNRLAGDRHLDGRPRRPGRLRRDCHQGRRACGRRRGAARAGVQDRRQVQPGRDHGQREPALRHAAVPARGRGAGGPDGGQRHACR